MAIDTETFRFAAGNLAPRLVCLTSHATDELHPKLFTRQEALDEAFNLLAGEDLLVLANAPYDLAVLAAADESLLPLIFQAYDDKRILDIQTWQRLYMIASGHSKFDPRTGRPPIYTLEALVSYWLSESIQGKHGEDAWRMRYAELVDLPAVQWPAEAKEYALNDATYTKRTAQQMVESVGIPPDTFEQCKYHFALHLMSAWGLRTDAAAVELLEADLDAHVNAAMRVLLEKGIYRWGGTKAKPKTVKDTKEIRRRVEAGYAAKSMSAPRTECSSRFPDGQIKLDDETLVRAGDPDLALLAEIGADQKLQSTYVPKLKEGITASICPRYTPVVDTGRTSSSNPNIQNQPRKGGVRECFIPRPGYIFVDIDYNIAELRSLAQVLLDIFGESAMADIIRTGKDIHCMMGASILGLEYDDFVYRLKKLHDPECKDARQMAKALDFGAPGGLGPATFIDYARVAYNVTFTEERARELIELYKSTFPEMRRYFYWMGLKAGSGNSFKLIQHRSKRVRGGLSYTNGCNCVDYATEALTTRGWVSGYELLDTDVLLTLNPQTLEYEWQQPTTISHFPEYRGDVVRFRTNNLSAETTPEHRWLARTREGVVFETTTEKFSSKNGATLVRTGEYKGGSPWSDAFVRLIGWVLTDGTYVKDTPGSTTIRIYQSKAANAEKVQRIKGILQDNDIQYAEGSSRDLAVLSFSGPVAKQLRELFPLRLLTSAFVATLSAEQSRLLLDEMVLGDGSCSAYAAGATRHIGTRSKDAADAIQVACVLAGISSHVKVRNFAKYGDRVSKDGQLRVRSSKDYYVVTLLQRTRAQVLDQHQTKARSTEGVWCPTVPNGFFVARRESTTYVTGNTLFQGLTADGAKLAVYNIAKECYLGTQYDDPSIPSPLAGSRMTTFVHDEIMLEAPIGMAQAVAARAAKVMCESMEVFTPDVPAVAEPCIMRRWYKDAEPAFDAAGNLVPWSPQSPRQAWDSWCKEIKSDMEPPVYLRDPLAILESSELEDLVRLSRAMAPEGKKPPKWEKINRVWLLEQLARVQNPDPWGDVLCQN